MSQLEQKTEVQEKSSPFIQFDSEEKMILLCERCERLLNRSGYNPGQICESRSIFVRFKKDKAKHMNTTLCGRRVLDIFSTYCTTCEYELYNQLNDEQVEEKSLNKFEPSKNLNFMFKINPYS